ncbi:transcription initiation factor TFIID subunit 12 [Euphorbia lathyris]|uniref:transcription initiation factor TFIID subunit 12 n=1 Tax=Euphorbia lathyris TaxID=212925 RepID=UPI003313EC72
MDNHVPATSASTPSVASTPMSQPTEPSPAPALHPPSAAPIQPPPHQQQQQQPPLSSQPPSSASTPPIASPNPNPNSSLKPSPQPLSQPHTTANRIPTLHRSWQHPHPHSHFPQFTSITSSPSPSLSASSGPSLTSSASHSVSTPQQRVGVAIGVPATHPSPSPSPFSSSFGQQYAGLGRGTINMPESVPNSSGSQVRGVQGLGMVGSMSSNSAIRPGGIPAHHQQRPLQSSIRPNIPSPNNQSTTQNFQGHGFMRPSPIGPSGSLGPNTSQSTQVPSQPWLTSGTQGKKPLPSPSFRPQINSPSLQQRSHIPQRHQSLPTASQQQHISPAQQQQPLPSHQPAEHYAHQFPPTRPTRSITEQLALQASTNSKQPSAPILPPNTMKPVTQSRTANAETEEPCNRILSKRSIHDLVSQIDPSEKLDPEVEDILVDIADEFVESITTFGCSLAKHRKSETLEAKDLLLHLERTWNMTLPGFSSDEIKTFRKPFTNDIHKERLAAIKKSILASEVQGAKITGGQAAGSAKSNMTKTSANAMIAPNVKIREVT